MADGGKGSRRRPNKVPQAQVDANWDRIFGKNPKMIGTGEESLDAYNEERLVSKFDKEHLKDKK